MFPPGIRHAAAAPGGSAWYWLSSRQRHAALDNYAAALGRDSSDPEVARVARRAFQNYGRMLMDFLLIGGLTHEDVRRRVAVDGLEHADAALARGRGVILAVPHTGSWDMSAAAAGVLGYPVTVVAERFPGSLNEAIVRTRERFGVKIVMLGRAAVRAITRALENNEVVGLACDLEQGPGVEVNFFGRRAIVPVGPASLALKTGAAIIPVYQYMTAAEHHQVHLYPALTWPDGVGKEGVMQRVIDLFEVFIRQRPDQWYAFRPMFKS